MDRWATQRAELLANIKRDITTLVDLRTRCVEHVDERAVARFYDRSIHVYGLPQEATAEIVAALVALTPTGCQIDPLLAAVLTEGTNREFQSSRTDEIWYTEAHPILASYLHVRWLLDDAIRYAPNETLGEIEAVFVGVYGIR